MSASAVARRVLAHGDHREFRRHWGDIFPHLADKGPRTDEEAEPQFHFARTLSGVVELKRRAWSHRWLLERGLPSGLPDRLRPSAEQMCPRIAPAVGIAVQATSPLIAPAVGLIRRAMENAVLDAAAEGRLEDSGFVKARMEEARTAKVRELFGNIGGMKP
jgi:hypothetical protein